MYHHYPHYLLQEISIQRLLSDLNTEGYSHDQKIWTLSEIEKRIIDNPEILRKLNTADASILLRKAEFYKRKKIIDLILTFGKNFNFLEAAIIQGNINLVETFLKIGLKLDWDPDFPACRIFKNANTRKKLVMLLLQYGQLNTGFIDESGQSLLEIFLEWKIFCGPGVDFNCEDNIEVIKILIDSGLSVNETRIGLSVFQCAVCEGNYEAVSFFISNGANVNQQDYSEKFSPLHLAVEFDIKVEIVDLLLSSGAEINAVDNKGQTALHFACSQFYNRRGDSNLNPNNRENVISLLLQKGAFISAMDIDGKTPFHLVCNEEIGVRDKVILAMVKEFSKLKFEDIPIFESDFHLIQTSPDIKELFVKCTNELYRMKSIKFYDVYSYYSVLKMFKNIKKLAYLTKNKDFVKNFEEKLHGYSYYQSDLRIILDKAIQVRNKLNTCYTRLFEVFENLLPAVVIKKLTENLALNDFQDSDNFRF